MTLPNRFKYADRTSPIGFQVWPSRNLWPNADFENGIDDWEGPGSTEIAWSSTKSRYGTFALQWHGPATANVVDSYPVPILASTRYAASLFLNPDEQIAYKFFMRDQDKNWIADGDGIPVTCPANRWTRLTVTGTTGGDDTGIILRIEKDNDENDAFCYVDGVQLLRGSVPGLWGPYDGNAVRNRVIPIRQLKHARVLK